MSQAQLAHPELSDSYVSLIESGKRSPTKAVVDLLASKLDCSPTYLIDGVTADELSELELALSYARLALENGESEEACRCFEDLLANDRVRALDRLQTDAEHGHALALEATGDLRGAAEKLEELLSDLPFSDDRRVAVSVALCRCLKESGQLAASIRRGEDLLAAGKANGWNDEVVELGSTLLGSYIERGDRIRATQMAQQLLEVAEELGTPRAIVAACWNAAILAQELGKNEKALQLSDRALAIQSETGTSRSLARLRLAHAVLLMQIRPTEVERAREALLKAQKEMRESSASTIDLTECTIELARTEILLGHPEAAVQVLTGMEMPSIAGKPALIAADLHFLLADAHLALGEPVEATAALASAADLLEEMQASRRAAEAWFGLAEQLIALDDANRGKSAYYRAFACAGL